MSDVVDIIRAIVRDEMASLRLGDIAEVTAVYAHATPIDGANHECDVTMRETDVTLTRVPMTTPHIGMVSTPNVGDLVLISYVNGDANRPIIVGRLYHATSNPPVHAEGEWRVEAGPPAPTPSAIAIDDAGTVVVTAGITEVKVDPTGAVEISSATDLSVDVKGNVSLSCINCSIDAMGTIDLGSGGGGVITTTSHKCYFTGAPLIGSLTVTAKP